VGSVKEVQLVGLDKLDGFDAGFAWVVLPQFEVVELFLKLQQQWLLLPAIKNVAQWAKPVVAPAMGFVNSCLECPDHIRNSS